MKIEMEETTMARLPRLKDKIAVVTGSGSGIGEGIVRSFAEEGARVLVANVRSSFICMQQAVKDMKERGGGSIINVGSVNAYIGESKLMAYSPSKVALMTLTKILASYLNNYRIRVNQLYLG